MISNMNYNKSKIQVVGLGQASIDYLGLVPAYPKPDTKCEFTDLVIQGGGPAATAMVALSRLGVPAAFIGAVGDDDFGRFIREGLVREGVDISGLITAARGKSQFAFIAVEPGQGRRTIFWQRGLGIDLPLEKIDLDMVARARVLHVDGLDLEASLAAARVARAAGRLIVFDAGTLRRGSLDLAALTDYLICSENFFRAFHSSGGLEQGLKRLWALGLRQAIVTLGLAGSAGFDGETFHRQAAHQVRVVDTTGAGDVYHGAYIYGILAGWDMVACMRFASAAAALKCERVGGRTGIPNLSRLREFLGPDFPGA